MECKRSVHRVRLAALATLPTALIAALLVLAIYSPPTGASSSPRATRQADGSETGFDSFRAERTVPPQTGGEEVATPQRATMPQRSATDRCTRCHAAPTAYHYGLACGQCHSASSFLPAKATAAAHRVKLLGEHAALSCATCHKPARVMSQECSTCHTAPKVHLAGACSTCHGPEGWAKSAASAGITGPAAPHLLAATDDCRVCHMPAGPNWPAPANHISYSASQCLLCHRSAAKASVTVLHKVAGLFQGRHAKLDCVQCHSNGKFEGTSRACSACHLADDRHSGQFGQDCGRCHTPNGWAGATFDHGQTGFALAGAHRGAACAGCHPNGRFDGTPTGCVACHQADDRHSGQFGPDCGRCHTPNGWAGATFDHGQTGFVLTGAHGGTACASCHPNGRFDGTPTECVACHGEPGYHAGTLGTDCATCHQTGGWLPASYSRPHGFPLGHNGASGCRTCHPGSLAGYTCYGCHNQGEIAEKHIDHGIPDYANCVACHAGGDD